jgi:hypothetical protein
VVFDTHFHNSEGNVDFKSLEKSGSEEIHKNYHFTQDSISFDASEFYFDRPCN